MMGLFSFVWSLAILFVFLRSNTLPFDAEFLSASQWGHAFLSVGFWSALLRGLGGALLISLAAHGLGRRLLKLFSSLNATRLEKTVWSFLLGLGAVSYSVLALSLVHLLYSQLVGGLILLGAGWELKYLLKNRKINVVWPAGWLMRAIVLALSAGLVINLLISLCPEIFYDALVYHLGLPQCYLQHHQLVALPQLMATFPMTIQFLYAAGLSLGNETVCKILHLSLLVLTCLSLVAFGKKSGRPLGGWLAALIYFFIPVLQLNVMTSGVDAGASSFAVAAFLAYFSKEKSNPLSRSHFLLAAVFSGLALGSKYTMALVPALILFIHLVEGRNLNRSIGLVFREGLFFSAVVILIWLPWGIKNTVQFGNPVAPFLNQAVANPSFPQDKFDHWVAESRANRHSVLDLPKDLWRDSLIEKNSYFFLGPLFLGLMPFLIWCLWKTRDQTILLCLGAGGLYLLLGMSYSGILRYWLPGFALMAMAVGLAGDWMIASSRKIDRRIFISAFFFLLLAQSALCSLKGGTVFRPLTYWSTGGSEVKYWALVNPHVLPNPANSLYRWMNENLPKKSVVLILGDEKAYPLKRPYYYAGVFNNNWIVQWANESKDPAAIRQRLAEKSIQFIVVNEGEISRLANYRIFNFSPEGKAAFISFWNQSVRLKYRETIPSLEGNQNHLCLYEVFKPGEVPDSILADSPIFIDNQSL